MRHNRAVLGWPWITSCFACTSYDEMGAFFVSLSWVNLCGDKVVSVRTELAPNKYAWYRRQKLNRAHCSVLSSPLLSHSLSVLHHGVVTNIQEYECMGSSPFAMIVWEHYSKYCTVIFTTQNAPLPIPGKLKENCVLHIYKQTMWKMWWLCSPLFAGSNLPCLNGDLCIRDGFLASIDNGLCWYHFTSLCLHNVWWVLPHTSAFFNTNCRKYICSELPYY